MALALMLAFLVLTVGSRGIQGSDNGALDCCLKYSQKKIPASIVRTYRRQELNQGCSIPAIIFSPWKKSQADLCADPTVQWVQELVKRLDEHGGTLPKPQRKNPCRKDRGSSKSGKKGRDSRGCKRTEPRTTGPQRTATQ